MDATNTTDLRTLRRFASDIVILAYHSSRTLEQAADDIEARLDGSQPADLMTQALDLARDMDAR